MNAANHSGLTDARDGQPDCNAADAARLVSTLAVAATSLGALSACGGGGSSAVSTETSTAAVGGVPARAAAPLTPEQGASRFLQQAGFAASEAAIAEVLSLGYAAWVEKQFAEPVSPSNWDWLLANGYAEPANNLVGFTNVTWWRLITAPDVLRQRIALALSEFFVVGIDGVTMLPHRQFAMAAWWDLLCEHAFGNFRTLLEAVTLNAAMGRYLNTDGNEKEDAALGRQPDENYAREVMQLFTIGLYELNTDGTLKLDAVGNPIETYTLDTVAQLARVFTGWSIPIRRPATTPDYAREPMTLNVAKHSSLAASFLGTTIPAGTDGRAALGIALDTLFGHPNVGPFFGRQLIQRLITSNPRPAYVARVAAAFNDNGQGVRGDLKAVIRAVLLDDDARDDTARAEAGFGKLREPMLRFLQWARTFNATSATGAWNVGDLGDPATRLGQQPLDAPSVFNFFRPGYVPPNTSIAARALAAPEFQLVHESSVAGYLNFMQNVIASGQGGVRANYANELAVAADATALVKRLNLLLCAGQLPDAAESTVRDAVATIDATTNPGRSNRVYAAILLVMGCPEYLVQK